MKVTISVGGRFHAFYLAQQLLKRGYLKQLITSYPKFEVTKYGIPENKVSAVIIKEAMARLWSFLPSSLTKFYDPQYAISEIFDQEAKKRLIDSDILVAWSGFALHTLRRAKDMGIKTILERGSSHILYQTEILKEEYEKSGLRPRFAHPKIVEKELKEYEEADYISIPSTFTKKTFLNHEIPESKLIHVPYGVDLDSFRQIPKEDKVFRVIHCGGMTLRKGVHYLLQAFHELNLLDSELWLIGSMGEEMQPFFRRFGNSKVIHKGPYPQNELYKYYSQGSVFVIMSIEEGLAVVQTQAMACGLPVICTTNTGGEDIIRDGLDGFIIAIRGIKSLKEKLSYLYENRDTCKAMGQSAKERVSRGFTWDDYGDRMVKAYSKCIEHPNMVMR
ncbi:MAG: glycosyltransferase family 4 protein [Candidatus Omnitrophica bacterium]|nr:glycosyltransferase family 4 protein [Candidatus Omnitrophota bacterium]